MEATKKTSTTRAALVVIAALSMLLSGLFIASAASSDASPAAACPDGFALTADAKNCFQAAVITSADNPNSCDQGQLTPDGSKCYVAAKVLPQEGDTLCPTGYSPDDSLGGMCARFEAATQLDDACPDGARGVAGSCYILVAKGPAGAATCDLGTLTGSNCVITGDAPVAGTASCPESDTVISNAGECYTLVAPASGAATCTAAGYVINGTVCKASNPHTGPAATDAVWPCPAGPTGVTPDETSVTLGGITKIASCTYPVEVPAGSCVAPLTDDGTSGLCRRAVDLRPGALACPVSGFGLVNGTCVRYEAPSNANPQCPSGSVEVDGDCRKPVADSAGAYTCTDANAALNGKSCVWTAGFLVDPSPTLYKCEAGVRTVIGIGDSTQVICILGDANANTTSGPSCLQGVLSTDNAYCIVPRIDTAPAAAVAAPVPSFTG